MRASHQTNQQCSSPGVLPKFKALPINYSCCLMRAEPPGGQGRGASLPLQTLFHNIQLCQAWMGNARGSTGSIPRMPLEHPKRSCAESPASPTEVRMLQQCSALHLPTSPSRSSPPPPGTGVIPTPRDLARTQSRSKQWT